MTAPSCHRISSRPRQSSLPLRGAGDILLVSCYELGHAPHGLALPLSFLRGAGFNPSVLDLSIDAADDELIAAAQLIAISVPMHTALRIGVRLLERIRRVNPTCQVGFFGLYAPLNAEYLLGLGAGWVLGGESESALVAIAQGAPPPPTADAVTLAKLRFPTIERDLLPTTDHYAKLERADGSEHAAGYAETSRGCLDKCRHCPIPAVYGGRFFVIDKKVVLDDIGRQIDAGAEHISFGDPDFLNGPGHSLAIARELHRRWPQVSFDVTTQVSHLLQHDGLIEELAELNCAFVVSAFESLSDTVLSRLHKRHRRAGIVEVTRRSRAAGLALRPTFVPFTPWTTADDLCDLIDFIDREHLVTNVAPVQLSIRLLVPPGSLLLADTDSGFGELDAPTLSHHWVHDDPRVDSLQRDIASRVELASNNDEPVAETFGALTELIYRAAGRTPIARVSAPGRAVPRMTEPWFC